MLIDVNSKHSNRLAGTTGTGSMRPRGVPEPSVAGMFTVLGILVVLLPACMSMNWGEQTSRSGGTRTSEQKSSRGNPPFYVVFGERYYVMAGSQNYREKGVASWYGKKFHGKPTSSGEIYDMHEMTAAHKSLPLPTRVRVTNLANGKSVIVKVNDRGPFVDNRIIDMSYAAATKLDMINSGTALVEVEALGESAGPAPIDRYNQSVRTAATTAMSDPDTTVLYLQIGAFGEQLNARQLQEQLESNGFSNVRIHHDIAASPALYRVRLGPILGVEEYDALVTRMSDLQINDTHLVTETSVNTVEPSGT
jgi:rare lipoprotein A